MNLNKQPLEIRQKIKHHLNIIKTLNSTELLEYSKGLKSLKEDIGEEVMNYLFKAIDLRTIKINGNTIEKQECCNAKMIKTYLKDNK